MPTFVQPPLDVYEGDVDALVELATVNVPLYGALAGDPVKVVVGSIFVAVVDWDFVA